MELFHGTDEWYCSTDYIHGNLYEAEELFRQGHEVQSNTLYLIHYPDGIVYEPIPKEPNQYIGCYEIVGDKIMKKNWKIIFWAVLFVIAVIGFIATIVMEKKPAYISAPISVIFTAVFLFYEIRKNKKQQ